MNSSFVDRPRSPALGECEYEPRNLPHGVTIGSVFGGIVNSIIAGGDVIVNDFTGTDEARQRRNRLL